MIDIKRRFTPSKLLTIAFVLSLFLLFFIGGLSYRQIKRLTEAQESVIHSLQVRINLEKLFSELKDAEAAHRGYLITHDSRYNEPYNYSHVRINKSLLAIKELLKADPQRQKDFDVLDSLINERFRAIRYNISESKHIASFSDAFKERLWEGNQNMDEIRRQINRIIESEDAILEQQEKAHADEISVAPVTSLLVVVFSVFVFLYTFNRISSNLRQMRQLNHRLRLMNETFNFAEKIGEICHWQYDINSGALTFSDNKFTMLGFEPQSFTPTVEKFLERVHPQDRKKVRNAYRKDLTTDSYSVYFRIQRNDRKVRYMKSISKLTLDSEGREIIVGVDCNITVQHQNIIKLEQRNIELKSSNAELSSFNHIVSHDLQEPLRKIQMFISRFDPSELGKLSENSQNYFDRIRKSAVRAQKLIGDLLVYSRLNRSEKKPEPTDLNVVLENAQNELSEVIGRKNAKISADELPTLRLVPDHTHQVFCNLLSNSLKYAKDDVAPEITISYQIVNSKNVPSLNSKSRKRFHEITFTDNGIGFEQQYAERIFVLFHRLHDRDHYSGTGIGLAICRKMVENHNGVIYAYGEPGVGATFKIYFPL